MYLNKKEDVISIVITVYNRINGVKRLFESISKQRYKNVEIIVADDNSDDDIKSVIDSYNDSRIVYFKNEINLGYANNCKKALDYCSGEYVIFLSDDDCLIDETFFEKAMESFENKEIDCSFGRIAVSKGDDFIVNHYPFEKIYNSKDFLDEIIKLRFSFLDYFSFSSFLFKVDLFKQINPFDTIFSRSGSVDISSIIKYVFLSKKVGFIDVVAYEWVKSCDTSLSGEKKDDLVYQTLQTVSAGIDIYNFFDDKDICKKVCNEYIKYSFNAILSDFAQLQNQSNLQNILKDIEQNSHVYIYGRGWSGLELEKEIKKLNLSFKGFIDDFKTGFEDTISYKEFEHKKEDSTVIISNYKYDDIYRIYKKLSKLKNITIVDLVS